jgi:PIN domain nuclease of toxin-antitoxin system
MILLDTHAWIWWVTESRRLSPRARRAINDADAIGVSPLSCWEVAMLVQKGRIGLTLDVQEWVDHALQRPGVQLVPLDPAIAVQAALLPGQLPGDPIDRFLAATCRAFEIPLVTKDQSLQAYPLIQAIW